VLTAESTPEKPCKECNYTSLRGGEGIAEFKTDILRQISDSHVSLGAAVATLR